MLAEAESALVEIFTKKGIPEPAVMAATQRQRMQDAFPEAMVSDYEAFMTIASGLPDTDDTHVLAAALKGQASTIVTDNMRDFPENVLTHIGIEVKSTDDFLANTIELDIGKAVAVIRSLRERYKNPAITADDLLLKMEAVGLTETVDMLRSHIDSL